MATSDDRLRASLRRTEQRQARARARRARQMRRLYLLLGGAGLVLSAAWLIRRTAPAAPSFLVTWPHPKLRQSQQVSDGGTVLLRPGHPLTIAVENPERWKLHWYSEDVLQDSGQEYHWSPLQETATLTVNCRARASGLGILIAWLWPARQLKLHGMAATLAETGRQQVEPPPGGIWIFPSVMAFAPVAWDDRALGLLFDTAVMGRTLVPSGTPPRLWTLVPSFSDLGDPRDEGTYVSLAPELVDQNLFAIARRVARVKPAASLKLVLRLHEQPAVGLLRIALDGKGKRSAWVKRAGEATGRRLNWPRDEVAGRFSGARVAAPLKPGMPGVVIR